MQGTQPLCVASQQHSSVCMEMSSSIQRTRSWAELAPATYLPTASNHFASHNCSNLQPLRTTHRLPWWLGKAWPLIQATAEEPVFRAQLIREDKAPWEPRVRPSDPEGTQLALLGVSVQHPVSPVPPRAGIISRAGCQRKGEAAALPAPWVLLRPGCGRPVLHSGWVTQVHCECATDTRARERKRYLQTCSPLGCTGNIAGRNESAPAPALASLPSAGTLSRTSCKEKVILKDVMDESARQHPC